MTGFDQNNKMLNYQTFKWHQVGKWIDAIQPLRCQLSDIYDALLEIYEDTNHKGSSGNSIRVEAKDLADADSKYELVVSVVTWYDILFEINTTSKHLQNKDAD